MRAFKDFDPAKDDIVVFDLETQFLADEVGGWGNKAAMKVSVAVLWSFREQAFRAYTEAQVPDLLQRLRQADLVIGFNQLGFDYEVLKPYGGDFLSTHPSLDLLAEVARTLGHRLKLESLTKGTLGAPKGADGLQAVAWWREGKLAELHAYCQKDVEQTRDLWIFGRQNGHLVYDDRRGPQRVAADW